MKTFEQKYKPDSNGLFPACPKTSNSDMKHYWTRDNFFLWKCGYYREEIAEAFKNIVQKHREKIEILIDKGHLDHDWEFIHPRYDENLDEVEGEWAWKQLDSLYYLSKVLNYNNETKEGLLIEKVMREVNFNGMGASIWEDADDTFHGYDYALMEYEIRPMLYEKPNLSHLVVVNEFTTTRSKLAEKIVNQVQDKLEGEWGVARYKGDKWTGEDFSANTEYQWCMGFAYLYYLTGDDKYIEKLDKIYDKFGAIPESINPENGEANCNTPLLWAEALYHNIKNNQ